MILRPEVTRILNYPFYRLVRNIPLHLNSEHLNNFEFNKFCHTILSNREIKQNIISLNLSDEGTCRQIQSFLTLFSLSLSNLYRFSCTCSKSKTLKIIPVLPKLRIHILTVPSLDLNPTSTYGPISTASLTVAHGYLFELCPLFEDSSMLKYLKIGYLYDICLSDGELILNDTNTMSLKQLIIDFSATSFKVPELFLPNLKIFSIVAPCEVLTGDDNRGQHLIETSLPFLYVFNFCFISYIDNDDTYEKLIFGINNIIVIQTMNCRIIRN